MLEHSNAAAGKTAQSSSAEKSATPGKKTQVHHVAEEAAATPSGINLSALQSFIAKHEGYVDHVYLDSRGFLTAGIGHLLTGGGYHVGQKISASQITAWFNADVAKAIAGAKQDMGGAFDRLDEDRKMVIIDMVFNMGSGPSGFGGFHSTIAAISAGNYAQAADDMLHSLWASQVGNRAREDAALMRHGGGTPGGGGGKQGGGGSHGSHGGGHGGQHQGPHTPTLADVRTGKAVIRVGDRGQDVMQIQSMLHVAADGIFGRHTLMAVDEFQRTHNLAVDGIVGEHTLAALEKAQREPKHGAKPAPHDGGQPSTGGASPEPGGQHAPAHGGQASHGGANHGGTPKAGGKWSTAPALSEVEHGAATLHEGEKGASVKHVQELLAVTADGEFGPMTKAAVVEFQHEHKEARHDGVVDAHTLSILAKHPVGSLRGESRDGSAQRARMLSIARSGSIGRQPDGRCYYHVCQFLIQCGGYGKIRNPYTQFPSSDLPVAHDFADLMNARAAFYGLERLGMHNPYDAPPGSIVVVAAGSPGTANPTAGDISVADGHGNFFNGGMMSYGGRVGWNEAPRANLLGVYVPR